ncbi:hypothetical protein LNKW23_11620 [Paralimibaculum aggregatum]|uniref:Uncharacterized protein n=1 Tax=Paralimibaculum aggregatum TaxID=3036245 RepID=A0ABQ6LF31_9RHOB|nr:hypothetical protein [Limibaculum sp. NKW23]GMG81949.1 hypothetical protein LNKW23_11620 [Limibaculum sp. NKW23]
MASKSKSLRKLEAGVRDTNKRMRPEMRARLRQVERMVRDLRAQIRRLHNIRTQIKRNQIPLLEDLKLTERLIGTIKDIDKEHAEAVKAKNRLREKEMLRRYRRRDTDGAQMLRNLDKRSRKLEDIDEAWVAVLKELEKLSAIRWKR